MTSAIGGRDNVILVAQSLGGFTAPLVATTVPVLGLVFVNAMIPQPGETPGQWWGNTGSSEARIAAAEAHGYGPDVDLAVYFLHDVPAEVVASGEPHQRPEADAVSDRCATSAAGRLSRSGSWPARMTGFSRSSSNAKWPASGWAWRRMCCPAVTSSPWPGQSRWPTTWSPCNGRDGYQFG